jgi:isocitrate lyase
MQLELVAVGTFVAHIASEDEEQQPRCGSMSGRITVPRDRYIRYWRLMNDYFFDPHMFVTTCFAGGMCNMIHTVIHTFQTG